MVLKGLIIYFDGPDGVGKTTQLEMAAGKLADAGHEVFTIHALGGTPIGEKLGQAMMSSDARPVETDLYIALAAQYASLQELETRRNQNQIILVDRSPLSIIAYQVFGGGINPEKGYAEASALLSKVRPDALLMFTASPEARLARREQRNEQQGKNYFENMSTAYHDETAKGYAEAAVRLGATIIDCEPSADVVHESTMQSIMPLLRT